MVAITVIILIVHISNYWQQLFSRTQQQAVGQDITCSFGGTSLHILNNNLSSASL